MKYDDWPNHHGVQHKSSNQHVETIAQYINNQVQYIETLEITFNPN